MENKSIGLETLVKAIKNQDFVTFDYVLKDRQSDFRVEVDENPRFVQPYLSYVDDLSNGQLGDVKIVLIEAVGAAGKTELTKNLSFRLKSPIYDLGKTRVVAGYSLTGLLSNRLTRKDWADYLDNISSGKSTIIIDALDEGYLKSNHQGFLDFLDDVVELDPQNSCPIIMLGRYNAVELTALSLLEKDIPFATLQIEPFTMPQAKVFIDRSVTNLAAIKYESTYRQSRDIILEKIGGIFKDPSSIKEHASEKFIGYAPVLLSIAALFDERTNYQLLLDDLQSSNTTSVSLIIDIIERILKRDREQKVFPILECGILSDRSPSFVDLVHRSVYSNDEQCARILYSVCNIPFPDISIADTAFLSSYNESMKDWISEHPFMGKRRIANIVFESYILARLIKNPTYQDVALSYMDKQGVSYMFFFIYNSLYGLSDTESYILPHLYKSLSQLNTRQVYYSMDLTVGSKDEKDGPLVCDVVFWGSGSGMLNYEGSVSFSTHEHLDFGDQLEYLFIDVPLDFHMSSKSISLSAPSHIHCKDLIIESEEITVNKYNGDGTFLLECEELLIDQKYENYLKIVGPGRGLNTLRVICPQKLEYPLYDYRSGEEEKLKELGDDIYDKYKKLRTIILEFRSHSKRELAKHHERIDFVHGRSEVGKAVIKALKGCSLMYQENHLYKLDARLLPTVLGVSYDGIRNLETNATIIRFLKSI